MNDSKLIQQIVQEVVRVLSSQEKAKNQKPNLLLVGNLSLKERLQPNWNVIPYKNEKWNESEIHHVLFVDATQDVLIKGALGIMDTPENELLSNCLWESIPISIIPNRLLQEHLFKKDMKQAPFKRKILEFVGILQEYGVEMESLDSFLRKEISITKTSQPSTQLEKRLITQEEIEKVTEKEVWIEEKTIVTPLALDKARELGIAIKFTKD